MEFLEKNIRVIVFGFVAIIAIGLIMVFLNTHSKNKEEKAQEKLAQIEFDYSKYKEQMSQASMPTPPNPKDKTKAENKSNNEAMTKAVSMRAQLISQLNQFVNTNEKTIATRIAALYLSELFLDEGKSGEALNTLKAATESSSKDLTSVLVQKKLGSLLADNNQCDEALKVWDNVLKVSSAQVAHSEIKIQQSLCYEKMNNLKKAEEILTAVKNDKSENSAEYVQNAEKILRLIQFRKASGS